MGRSRAGTARIATLTLAVLLGLLAVGCSPESLRTRGGGPGADVGNRFLGPSLNVHGPVDPLYGQPLDGQAVSVARSTATPTANP